MARLFSKNLQNNFGNFWRTFRERRLQGGRRDGKIGKNERRRGYDPYNERVFSAGDAGDCVLLPGDRAGFFAAPLLWTETGSLGRLGGAGAPGAAFSGERGWAGRRLSGGYGAGGFQSRAGGSAGEHGDSARAGWGYADGFPVRGRGGAGGEAGAGGPAVCL